MMLLSPTVTALQTLLEAGPHHIAVVNNTKKTVCNWSDQSNQMWVGTQPESAPETRN